MNPAFYLKNVSSMSEISHSMNLEQNLVMYFDFGTLLAGGYQNIYFNSTDYAGQPVGTLKPSVSRQYASGRAWEAYRTNWAWESGSGINPINITGVYVNGVFSGSGFSVDYKHGQIVFDSGISTNSTVKCSYSPKTIFWDTANSKWHRELITETYKYQAFDADGIGQGIRSVLNNHRIQLPAVIIEVTPENAFQPLQLGGGAWYNPRVNFYIFTENMDQKKKISDMISSQTFHSFLPVDFNIVANSGDFPVTPYGFKNSGAKTFPELYANYPWATRPVAFENLEGRDVPYVGIYRAIITGRCKLQLTRV